MTVSTAKENQTHAERPEGLLAWQWALYREGHANRRSLLIHALTAPVFWLGTLALTVGMFANATLVLVGAGLMVLVVALQGGAHRMEAAKPVPFRNAGDFVARFFVEQWITFPRYVLSGKFAQAFRKNTGAE